MGARSGHDEPLLRISFEEAEVLITRTYIRCLRRRSEQHTTRR
jgi:hypothetical protein